jgi:hypothetical protein
MKHCRAITTLTKACEGNGVTSTWSYRGECNFEIRGIVFIRLSRSAIKTTEAVAGFPQGNGKMGSRLNI